MLDGSFDVAVDRIELDDAFGVEGEGEFVEHAAGRDKTDRFEAPIEFINKSSGNK